jgi:hypothetical protein
MEAWKDWPPYPRPWGKKVVVLSSAELLLNPVTTAPTTTQQHAQALLWETCPAPALVPTAFAFLSVPAAPLAS